MNSLANFSRKVFVLVSPGFSPAPKIHDDSCPHERKFALLYEHQMVDLIGAQPVLESYAVLGRLCSKAYLITGKEKGGKKWKARGSAPTKRVIM